LNWSPASRRDWLKRSRFSEEQIISILREHEEGTKTTDLCRKHGISSATFYAWKAMFGGMEVSEAKRLRALEAENAKLKKLLAEGMLDNAMLKEIASKNSDARQARGCRSFALGVRGERAAGVFDDRPCQDDRVSFQKAKRCGAARTTEGAGA
jgi:putative transposase